MVAWEIMSNGAEEFIGGRSGKSSRTIPLWNTDKNTDLSSSVTNKLQMNDFSLFQMLFRLFFDINERMYNAHVSLRQHCTHFPRLNMFQFVDGFYHSLKNAVSILKFKSIIGIFCSS